MLYTLSIEFCSRFKLCKMQPVRSENSCQFLITSCSCEKRYQAFSYCAVRQERKGKEDREVGVR